jgi:DNA-binding GntR family transcriptional regulator
MSVKAAADETSQHATARATSAVRDMIMHRRLRAGQQLRQEQLAERLNLSRSPLREALRILETEGFVQYVANHGYFVTDLSAADLSQIYVMRRLLESELLRSIPAVDAEDVARLRAANGAVAAGVREGSIAQILSANREFHLALLSLSASNLILREVERLWQLSEAYRAGYLWLPETRTRIVAEHDGIIDALERHDLEVLVHLADQHRGASEQTVTGLLLSTGDDDDDGL